MKTKLFSLLTFVMVCSLSFTSCQDEEPFSMYQIGASFPASILIIHTEESQRTEQEKQDLKAMQLMNLWLLNNSYIRTTNSSEGPIVIQSADEVYNDEQAMRAYDTKYQQLNVVDLDQIMAGLKANASSGLTGTGSFSFNYYMIKGTVGSTMTGSINSFSVDY